MAGIKKVTMELGSNAPVIVMPDADLNKVAEAVAATGYANAGQVCISAQRILTAGRVYSDFLSTLKPKVEALTTGDQLDEKVKVGPMIREKDAARVDEWIREAVSAGARLGRVWEDAEGSRSIRAAEETLPPAVAPELFPLEGSNWIEVPVQAFAGISPGVKLQRGVSQPFRVGIVPESRLRPWYEAVTTAKFNAPPAAVSVLGEIEALIAAARRAGGPSVALVFAASSFEDRFAE